MIPNLDPALDPWMNPPYTLHIIVPFLPPTSNSIYLSLWKMKRIVKSKEATSFYNRFLAEVAPKYLPWISRMSKAPDTIYQVTTHFYLDQWDLFNKGWFKTPRTAATRYKKMDTGNRLKLIHDCLSDTLGVDDMHFFALSAVKMSAQEVGLEPQVHIYINALETPKDPIGVQTLLSV